MSISGKPSGERTHIGFFGRRNVGKSSIINCVTGQNLSIVSDTLGTTTDPVIKSMEILPLGPVVVIDTPGIDDVGDLGKLRVQKSFDVLNRCDIVVVVTDITSKITDCEKTLIEKIKERKIPYIICYNKCDDTELDNLGENEICVSALLNKNIDKLKEMIASKNVENTKMIIGDKLNKGDVVVLVIPIDESAPKGRLILPQQMVLREILDVGSVAVCTKPEELHEVINKMKVNLVITDSQVFGEVSRIVPKDIPLTSFSILMLRYKGELDICYKNIKKLDELTNGSRILISEGCTHHRQCNDIGTVKLPNLIRKYTGKDIIFEYSSGMDFPKELSRFDMIIHCGGCMLNEREVKFRLNSAEDSGVPITNYGITLAYLNGILERSLEILV